MVESELVLIESLKLCVAREHRAEQSFTRVSALTVLALWLLQTIELGASSAGQDCSSRALSHLSYKSSIIITLLFFIAFYNLLKWIIAIIDLNGHSYHSYITTNKSLTAQFASWWDQKLGTGSCKNTLNALIITVLLLIFALTGTLLF